MKILILIPFIIAWAIITVLLMRNIDNSEKQFELSVTFGIIILLLFAISKDTISDCEEDASIAFSDGYEDGYSHGEEKGFESAKEIYQYDPEEKISEAYDIGYSEGYADGEVSGFNSGFDDAKRIYKP